MSVSKQGNTWVPSMDFGGPEDKMWLSSNGQVTPQAPAAPPPQQQAAAPAPAPAPPPDPYAQWGGQAKYNSLVSGFNTQKDNIYGSSRESAEGAALTRHSSILDWLDQMTTGQHGIDEKGVQNELAKKQGYNSISDMVGRGLRSGGTMLANKNALSSSAAQAIAMAYGDIGHREMNKVGNQYELQNREIGLDQDTLNRSKATGLRKFGESEQSSVLGIVNDARNKFASLDAAMVDADMPTRIAIEQEKAKVQQQVQGILGRYDTELNQGAGAINPTSSDARRATAYDLANKGVSAANPFDFSSEVPTQFQGTGPFSSEIPLFSTRGKRQTA
jgi:hypothetical protein